MSKTINLAGKNIIVDNVESTGADSSLLSTRMAVQQARSVNSSGLNKTEKESMTEDMNAIESSVEGLGEDLSALGDDLSALETSTETMRGTLARVGAQKTSGYNGKIDVYAYNPTKQYSASYSSDYYVSVGYAICNGMALPVSIPAKYTTFTPATKEGVWAICIHKANVLDEAYTPFIAYPYADGQTMKWYAIDAAGTVSVMTSVLNVWIIGSFSYTVLDGVSAVLASQAGMSPQKFLNDRFLNIMGEADDGVTTDFTDWAIAMKVDQIFKRLAVLELFVSELKARNLEIGTLGTGFSFRALSGNGTPVFDVYYDDKKVFQIDVTSGDIYFGGGLIYHAATDTIEANSAVFSGIQINNANGGEADFGSAIFSQSNPQTITLTINSTGGQGRTIYDWILTTFGISGPSGATPGWYSEYFSCSCSRNASVAFVRAYREDFNSMGVNTNLYAARFYNASKQEITALRAYRYETSQSDLNPFSVGDTISTVTGGNIMKFFGLPTQAAGLASGRVWNDNGTLKIVT